MAILKGAATIYLVGAGPGDPGLLTVAGAGALGRADVVVYDFLANAALLKLAPAGAERVYVGKSGTRHTLSQGEINELLVEKARQPRVKCVVRLKGGDPYVFGRGGEEGEFLRERGVPFVVVPGVTSGIAGPAYAGIPVTHRDFTSSITLVTGHEKEDADPHWPRVNYGALAKLDGTTVFYMGVKSLPVITQRLIEGGMDADTPVAVIRWATHPHQRTVTGTLATIVAVVAEAGITAPAITVVGKVVGLRETLNFFERRPLFGKRVIVTRTRQQASGLAAALAAAGATVTEAPTIELAEPEDWGAVDRALLDIPDYDWVVFTSANGVEASWKRLRFLGKDARVFGGKRVAAVGPGTAAALERIGIVPDVIPDTFVGEALAASLKAVLEAGSGAARAAPRALLLRADIARPVLREELGKLGVLVDDVAVYRTVRPLELPEEVLELVEHGVAEWVTFTSASTVDHFFGLVPGRLHPKLSLLQTLSIGPITTAALARHGVTPTVEATRHDIPGMVEALLGFVGDVAR